MKNRVLCTITINNALAFEDDYSLKRHRWHWLHQPSLSKIVVINRNIYYIKFTVSPRLPETRARKAVKQRIRQLEKI